MQAIDARELLLNLLDECDKCHQHFRENVALIVGDYAEVLTDEQVEVVLVAMGDLHRQH